MMDTFSAWRHYDNAGAQLRGHGARIGAISFIDVGQHPDDNRRTDDAMRAASRACLLFFRWRGTPFA
jgi:hypothetical protein